MQRWSIWWSSGLLVQRGRNRVNCRGGWDLWREQPLYRARESTNTGSGPKQRHLPLTQGCSLRHHHHQSQSSWFVQIPSDQQHGVAKSMSECASKCGSNWQRAKCWLTVDWPAVHVGGRQKSGRSVVASTSTIVAPNPTVATTETPKKTHLGGRESQQDSN